MILGAEREKQILTLIMEICCIMLFQDTVRKIDALKSLSILNIFRRSNVLEWDQ